MFKKQKGRGIGPFVIRWIILVPINILQGGDKSAASLVCLMSWSTQLSAIPILITLPGNITGRNICKSFMGYTPFRKIKFFIALSNKF
jgi:hypothetical protein